MLNTISQYTTFEKNIGFLQFKQDVVHNKYWLLFFYIHIFSIIFCLLAGLTQFSNHFLTENHKLHKIIGKIYVYNILIINFPACFVLALFSNGGIIGITGFLLQNFLWVYFTTLAVIYIKKGNIDKHRIFMILSYSITTTAITFRIIKNLVYQENIFSYHLFYGMNVWISLFINLSIAYIIIVKNKSITLSSNSNSINKNKKSNRHQNYQ
ncbi:DUF2306 domain-containing protein [Chryseobacterium limigenitum]